jgi:hypothetical protein
MRVVRDAQRLSTLLAAGALACSGMDPGVVSEGVPPVPPTHGADVIGRAQVEKDLALEIHRPATAPYEEDRNPHIGVALVNRSRRDLFLETSQTGTHVSGETIRPAEKRPLVGPSTTTGAAWGLRSGDRVLRVRAFWRVWDDDVFGQRMEDGTSVTNQRRVSSEWVEVAR